MLKDCLHINLIIPFADISSDDDIKLPASVLTVKKEQMADEESQIEKKHDPCVDVTVLSDYLPFLYKSRRKGGAKKSKGKQSKGNKNVTENAHFAEVSVSMNNTYDSISEVKGS